MEREEQNKTEETKNLKTNIREMILGQFKHKDNFTSIDKKGKTVIMGFFLEDIIKYLVQNDVLTQEDTEKTSCIVKVEQALKDVTFEMAQKLELLFSIPYLGIHGSLAGPDICYSQKKLEMRFSNILFSLLTHDL